MTVFDDYLNKHLSEVDKARADFLRLHPSLENVMGRDVISPEVDVLNKSLAYLAAKVEQKIDQSYPDVILKIFDLLAPEFIRPQPSATILNFTPKERVMLSAVTINKGTQVFSSQEGANRNVIFTTTDLIKVPPLSLAEVATERKNHKVKVVLDYDVLEGAVFSLADADMRFFINRQLSQAYSLYYALFNKSVSVCYIINGKKIPATIKDYGSNRFNLKYLDRECSRINLFQEFISFPERFLFFEIIAGGKNITIDKNFYIEIIFDDRNNDVVDIDIDTFILGCVAGINLEKATAIPIKRKPGTSQYPLYIDSYDESYSICDIKRVRSFTVADGVKKDYQAISLIGDKVGGAYEKVTALADKCNQLKFSLRFPSDDLSEKDEEEIIFTDLEVFHTTAYERMALSSVNKLGDGAPACFNVKNITRISEPLLPDLSGDSLWKLSGCFSGQYFNIETKDGLSKSIQSWKSFIYHGSKYQAIINRFVDSIKSVNRKLSAFPYKDVILNGVDIKIEVNGSKFSDKGEMYLFFNILKEIMFDRVDLGSLYRLLITDVDNMVDMLWTNIK
ncbi:type VI secretion system baseplate subunit TssF [Piscirickettsia salmonis]|uniref:type VI secretion system baseplate subunit TssF n=1 Tax=Piscirickettsia salmonis TaxID=1238 RepID=UPI000F08ED74|nr:hypothetical protein DA717_04450 [Piscirickettsiaceae bacterium NZ-RLO2]